MFRALARLPADDLSDDAFRVAMALAWFTDSEGLCYASLAKLAKKGGLKYRKSVVRGLQQLEALGFIVKLVRGHADRDRVKDRTRPGGFQATNYYQLLWVNPVNLLQPGTTLISWMPGASGGVPGTPPATAEGGVRGTPAGGDKTADLPPRDPYLVIKSVHNGGPADRDATRARWIQRNVLGLVHTRLNDDPMLTGVPLLDDVVGWLAEHAPSWQVSDVEAGAVIELAQQQRREAAWTRRQHTRRRRA